MNIIRGEIGDIQPKKEQPTLELTFESDDRLLLPQGFKAPISLDLYGKVWKGTICSTRKNPPYVHTNLNAEQPEQKSNCTQVLLNLGLIEGAIIDFEILPDKTLHLHSVIDYGTWRDGNEPEERKLKFITQEIESHKHEFESCEKTQREAIIMSRIGQGKFRNELIKLWGGCSVTGLSNISLLRASHIKPWCKCSNEERLDPMNGLLLHPTLDHLFDSGFITFEDNGHIRFSDQLSKEDFELLHITEDICLREVPVRTCHYLSFHRKHVFKL